jgi:hypothetical protein
MKIRRLKITKQKLAAMPEKDRTLLLLLGHAVNEINVLSKLILMVRKDDPQSDIINHVETGQCLIFLRLLVGKLHEAWLLFQKRVQADRTLRAKLLPQLDEAEGATALKALNGHFGRGSPLTDIRNKLSFHYTDDDNLTEENFQQLSDSEPWEFYLASAGNTFYYASELVMTASATQLASGNTTVSVDQAFKSLCDVAIEATKNLTCLFDELIAALVESIPDLEEPTTEELPDGPKLSEFCLPYFFS